MNILKIFVIKYIGKIIFPGLNELTSLDIKDHNHATEALALLTIDKQGVIGMMLTRGLYWKC